MILIWIYGRQKQGAKSPKPNMERKESSKKNVCEWNNHLPCSSLNSEHQLFDRSWYEQPRQMTAENGRLWNSAWWYPMFEPSYPGSDPSVTLLNRLQTDQCWAIGRNVMYLSVCIRSGIRLICVTGTPMLNFCHHQPAGTKRYCMVIFLPFYLICLNLDLFYECVREQWKQGRLW